MQAIDAEQLRNKWNGSDCTHPALEKEYANGIATGDYVCTTCGETGWGREWADRKKIANNRLHPTGGS